MEARRRRNADRRRYQGTRAAETALTTTVLPGFFALASGAGALHNAKVDLQRTTNAAVLAASAMLLQTGVADPAVAPSITEECLERDAICDRTSAFGVDGAELERAARDDTAAGHGFALSQTFPDAALAHALAPGRTAVGRDVETLAVTAGADAGRQPTQTIAGPGGPAPRCKGRSPRAPSNGGGLSPAWAEPGSWG